MTVSTYKVSGTERKKEKKKVKEKEILSFATHAWSTHDGKATALNQYTFQRYKPTTICVTNLQWNSEALRLLGILRNIQIMGYRWFVLPLGLYRHEAG